jgi:hypothetical protein
MAYGLRICLTRENCLKLKAIVNKRTDQSEKMSRSFREIFSVGA